MSKVQYRPLGKSGLKVSVPVVSYLLLAHGTHHQLILHSLVR
jgi:hypothetical protein